MAEENGRARGGKGYSELRRVLLEQHWQEARALHRQKMLWWVLVASSFPLAHHYRAVLGTV
jgi:hypothetical protein